MACTGHLSGNAERNDAAAWDGHVLAGAQGAVWGVPGCGLGIDGVEEGVQGFIAHQGGHSVSTQGEAGWAAGWVGVQRACGSRGWGSCTPMHCSASNSFLTDTRQAVRIWAGGKLHMKVYYRGT